MGRKKTDLRERLLKAADGLFYERGYVNTGITDIVAEAGTNKPGLYSYFPGKDDLAREYASRRNEAMKANIAALGHRAEDIFEFFRLWMDFMKHETRPGGSHENGCAVANFALQTDSGNKAMAEFIDGLSKRWVSSLTAYVRAGAKQGRFPRRPGAAEIARRMFVCHEGAMVMRRLTGSARYFDDAGSMFENWLRTAMEERK